MKDPELSMWKKLLAYLRTLAGLRPGAASLSHFAGSFVLCGVSLGLGPAAAALGPLTVCESGRAAACTLGVLLGYPLFWGLNASLPLFAVAAVVLCVRALTPGRRRRQIPAVSIAACAVICALPMLGASFSLPSVLRWLSSTALYAVAVFLFRAAQDREQYAARVGVFCALLPGLGAIRMAGGWNAAAAVLAWAACGSDALACACAGSAVLAAFSPRTAPWAAAFGLAAVLRRLLKSRPAELACAGACIVYCLAGIRLKSYGFSVSAMAGSIASLLLRPERLLPGPPGLRLPEHPAQRELRQAAKAMDQAAQMLSLSAPDGRREFAALLDEAGDRVCRSCARYSACWQEDGSLFEELTRSAGAVMTRGMAAPEDLPPSFRSRCLHVDAFLTALNDALDDQRARQRHAKRLQEIRGAAHSQYVLMEALLRRLSERLYAPDPTVNFQPELSVQAAGRGGSAVSGDRGAAFAGPEATYYVLLCDGMGTGPGAASESLRAVGLLRRLLQCGVDAERALTALNGLYLLRDDGCFSTVDLLRINLTSGDAILYKWGAAPSYLKRSHGLRRLGGANLPPGLDQSSGVETLRLRLDHGSVLVLVSDGLGGKETASRLEHCDSLVPRDLAASLFAGRETLTDDCTAVAVRLRRAAVREPVPI